MLITIQKTIHIMNRKKHKNRKVCKNSTKKSQLDFIERKKE